MAVVVTVPVSEKLPLAPASGAVRLQERQALGFPDYRELAALNGC